MGDRSGLRRLIAGEPAAAADQRRTDIGAHERTIMRIHLAGFCLLVATPTYGQSPNTTALCERLSSIDLPNTTITLAQVVDAGTFTLPAPIGAAATAGDKAMQAFRALPAFCRVAATSGAVSRLGHQDRSLAAGVRLERQVPGNGQWRLEWQYR